jgi:hypothetical protein
LVPISNVFSLPKPDASGHLRGVLVIRVWEAMLGSADPSDGGGLSGPPLIGDSVLLTNTLALQETRRERSFLLRILEAAVFFIVAVLALGMWVFDRSRRLHLWLGVFLLGFAGAAVAAFSDLERLQVYQWHQLYLAVIDIARDVGSWMLILALFGLDREMLWRRTTAIPAATIHLGPYNLNVYGQLQAIVLVVLVATIYREQNRERNRQLFVESELKSAQEIQNVLVPEETPSVPGFAISSLYWPAGEVGGDMFQVIPGVAGDVLIVLADVSGKGLKAAMTVSLLVGAVRTMADVTSDPLAILAALNQRLIGRSKGGFTTCLVLHV